MERFGAFMQLIDAGWYRKGDRLDRILFTYFDKQLQSIESVKVGSLTE